MIGFQQDISQAQNMQQAQRLTPQQQQTMKFMQASVLELDQMLKAVLEHNPVIDVSSPLEVLAGDPIQEASAAQNSSRDNDYGDSSWNEEAEEKRDYFFNSLTADETPLDKLQRQLDDLDELRTRDGKHTKLYDACCAVIGNLDNRGYLVATDEEIAQGAETDIGTAAQAVKIVQSFNPPGIAGHDLRETLLLQLERANEKGSIAWDIVDRHLDDLARNRIPQIADALDVEIEDVQDAVEHIREYNPRPGQGLNETAAAIIYPEVSIVRNRKGKLEVIAEEAAFPVVTINETYENMRQDKSLSSEDRDFLNKNLTEARQIISSLDYRKATIEKIASLILYYQKDFFEQGPAALKPLLMSTLAKDLEVNESTISRAVANKYMKTDYGIFPFRQFFTQACNYGGEEEVSAQAIRNRIAALVAGEDKEHPLSDQKMTDLLAKDGFDVARRTIAKYREAEGIPAASLRKIHKSH